jgi:hypothetical protein
LETTKVCTIEFLPRIFCVQLIVKFYKAETYALVYPAAPELVEFLLEVSLLDVL